MCFLYLFMEGLRIDEPLSRHCSWFKSTCCKKHRELLTMGIIKCVFITKKKLINHQDI